MYIADVMERTRAERERLGISDKFYRDYPKYLPFPLVTIAQEKRRHCQRCKAWLDGRQMMGGRWVCGICHEPTKGEPGREWTAV